MNTTKDNIDRAMSCGAYQRQDFGSGVAQPSIRFSLPQLDAYTAQSITAAQATQLKDAERYQWLRSNANTDLKTSDLTIQLSIEERWFDRQDHLKMMDAAIDAAITASKGAA